MSITIRVSEYELNLIKNYADLHGVNVSEMVRSAIIEKIEDEHDLKIAESAYDEWVLNGKKTLSHEEVWGTDTCKK